MKYQAYPAYKDSGVEWLGKIPEGWRIQKLKFLTRPSDERNGQTPHGDMLSVSGYRGIEVKDYEFEEQRRDDGDLETYRVVHEGQLVVNTMWLNYAGLGVSRHKGHVSPAYKAFYISEEVEKWFIHHFLRCTASVEGYKKYLRGIRPNSLQMPSEDFGAFPVVLPPLPTQQAIATFLDTETARIDGLIKDYEELVVLLQEKRQALISHAVTRGLSELVNPNDPEFGEWAKPVKFKDSGVEWLGEIPEGWRTLKLKAAIEYLTSGPRGWSERITDNGELFIQSGDLTSTGRLDFQNAMRVTVESDSEARRSQLRDGDVVVCITGAKTGNVALCEGLNESAYVNQHLCLIRPRKGLHPAYLSLFLSGRSAQEYFSVTQYGLKQGLSLSNVSDIPILLPGLDEQTKIAQYIGMKSASFDELVTEAESAIELLKEHRSALITNAVTGKINVEAFISTKGVLS